MVTADPRQPPSGGDEAAAGRVRQLLALVPSAERIDLPERIGLDSSWIVRSKRSFDIGDPYGDG